MKTIAIQITGPQYAIYSYKGYFERMDSWGNSRWTQNKSKAFKGLFGDCTNEIIIRSLRDVEVRAI